MAAGEDEAQAIVVDGHVVGCGVGLPGFERRELLFDDGLSAEQLGLLAQALTPAQSIDGPIAGRGRDPRTGVGRKSTLRPDLERADVGVLDGLFGKVEVAQDPDQRRDRAPLLLAEDAGDGVVRRARVASQGCVRRSSLRRRQPRIAAKSTTGRISTVPVLAPGILAA
jgi:hypothetical protein